MLGGFRIPVGLIPASLSLAVIALTAAAFSDSYKTLIQWLPWRLSALLTTVREGRKRLGMDDAGRRPVRVYMDGCFDMMHYGHANALRQAKALGDELVVGVVSDEEILVNKGPPVVSLEDRVRMVEEVKWVDEVIVGTPYCITPAFLHRLFTHHRIDFIIHGDDPCLLPDGSDAYAEAKQAGRFLEVRRTEGISSTDVVGRMLLCVGSRTAVTDAQQQESLQREFVHRGSPSLPPRPSSPLHPHASSSSAPASPLSSSPRVPCSPLRPSLPPPSSLAPVSSPLQPPAPLTSLLPDTNLDSAVIGTAAEPPSASPLENSPPLSPTRVPTPSAAPLRHSAPSLEPALPLSPSSASLPSSASSNSLWSLASLSPSSSASAPLLPSSLAPLASARVSRFLPATSAVVELSSQQVRAREPSARVVYIDGAFDVFHSGHVQTLRAAKQLGTFLLVGVHSDATVRANRGPHHPIMGVHERCLSLLACRSVDEVVLDAPWVVSNELIAAYNISVVAHGTVAEPNPLCQDEQQRYAAPMARGMVREVVSAAETTTTTIMTRIVDNHHAFIRRNAKKAVSDREYMESKRAAAVAVAAS